MFNIYHIVKNKHDKDVYFPEDLTVGDLIIKTVLKEKKEFIVSGIVVERFKESIKVRWTNDSRLESFYNVSMMPFYPFKDLNDKKYKENINEALKKIYESFDANW